ncbi:MAG TPA: ABC transporter ATP-binding protein [Candidatus Saccharimonadia bacterium]|nr:ABC transporter ATP-binding protein [Candidatus Saccharimonadia bacterium]
MVAPGVEHADRSSSGATKAPARGPAIGRPSSDGFDLLRVGLTYGSRTILEDLDLVIETGERVAIIGPNGAGKSSLLRILTGHAPERRGVVRLDGQPLESYSRESLARRLAVVPGEVSLPFAARVEDVVALGRIPHEHPFRGLRESDDRAIVTAIERVGIADLIGRDARRLSLGERQLVVLAMALAQAPRVLILDEPTVHLDLRHQVDVMELLRTLNERDGVGVIAVLHDLSLAAHFFPRLVLLDHGRIVADGAPDDVLSAERIRSVYGVDPALVRRS